MRRAAALLAATLLLGACGADEPANEPAEAAAPAMRPVVAPTPDLIPSAEAYDKVLAAAVEARAEAAAAGAEWLVVGDLLEHAAAAADQEDWTRAVRLADEARMLCELSLRQAEDEAQRWEQRVIR